MNRDDLAEIIGALAYRLTDNQVAELAPFATDNPTGLAKMVANVEGDPNIDSPIGVVLSRARRGDVPMSKRKRPAVPVDRMHRARELYKAKMALLERVDNDWSEAERRQHSIDYALDYCGANGQALFDIEAVLQGEHQTTTLSGKERDFERDTPHARLMTDTHGRANDPNYLPGEPEPIEVRP